MTIRTIIIFSRPKVAADCPMSLAIDREYACRPTLSLDVAEVSRSPVSIPSSQFCAPTVRIASSNLLSHFLVQLSSAKTLKPYFGIQADKYLSLLVEAVAGDAVNSKHGRAGCGRLQIRANG